MEKQTRIQKQIENTVTNGRGFKTPTEDPIATNYGIGGVIEKLSKEYFGAYQLIIDYQMPFTSEKALSMTRPSRAKQYDSPFDLKQALGEMDVQKLEAEGDIAQAREVRSDLEDIAKLRSALQDFGVEESVSLKDLSKKLNERRISRDASRRLIDFYCK